MAGSSLVTLHFTTAYMLIYGQGMEDLIRQAFLHIDVIGQHVADGRYDLIGPNGDIILPQVWETVVEPDWSVTMHMWPVPEKPKEPDPPPPPPEGAPIVVVEDAKPGTFFLPVAPTYLRLIRWPTCS